jgi:hypothetical protein
MPAHSHTCTHRAPAAARHRYIHRLPPATTPSRRYSCLPTNVPLWCRPPPLLPSPSRACHRSLTPPRSLTHVAPMPPAHPPLTSPAVTVASTAGLALSSVGPWSSLCHPAVSRSHCPPPRCHSNKAPLQPMQASLLALPSLVLSRGAPPPPSSDLCLYEENEFETWYMKWCSPW